MSNTKYSDRAASNGEIIKRNNYIDNFLHCTDRTAISTGEKILTYNQLRLLIDELSKQLANYGVCKGDVLITKGSFDYLQVIVLLCCLKNEFIFAPISNKISKNELSVQIKIETKIFYIESLAIDEKVYLNVSLLEKTRHGSSLISNDAAYLYFTSGSTGQQKSVLGKKKSLISYLYWFCLEFEPIKTPVTFCTTQSHFDPFIRQCMWTLWNGGTLVFRKDFLKKGVGAEDLLRENVNTIFIVPSLFNLLSKMLDLESIHFDQVFFAGEKLTKEYLINLDLERTNVINSYGPSEITLSATYQKVSQDVDLDDIPIGKPRPETELRIIDRCGDIKKAGIGELIIMTHWAAYEIDILTGKKHKGYQDELNLDTQYSVYKTGDFVSIVNGVATFIGRIDDMVKINGESYSLLLIARLVRMDTNVEDVFISKSENNDSEIDVFVIEKCSGELTKERVLDILFENNILIAVNVIICESFPLNENGKIDRNCLKKIANEKLMRVNFDLANDLVSYICEIFPNLEIKPDVHSNLISLGINSFGLIRLRNFVQEKFGVKLQIRKIFLNPNALSISGLIQEYFS